MLRKKEKNSLAIQKIQILIKQTHFSRDIFPEIAKLVRNRSKEVLKPYLTIHLKVMDCIKWLILLHNITFLQPKGNQTEVAELLQLINPDAQPSTIFESMLLQKLIKPYKAYLLKRNNFDLKEVDPQFHCFALINMLKSALSFTSILFTLGRYLFKKNNFLVQFNVIIAKDLAYLYRTLKMKSDDDFQEQNFEVLELLNDRMYNVYYNCYFYRFVSHYAPYWIEIDQNKNKTAKEIKSKIKIALKNQYKSQRQTQGIRNEEQLQNDVSIIIEQSSTNLKDHLKSTSTIASHRQSEFFQVSTLKQQKQKQDRERRRFIQQAEFILQSFKEIELNSS